MMYEIKVGPKDKNAYISYTFEMPKSIWDKWSKLSFHFKISDNTTQIAQAMIIPDRYIYIKERWYHRLASWIYFKFKRTKDAIPSND